MQVGFQSRSSSNYLPVAQTDFYLFYKVPNTPQSIKNDNLHIKYMLKPKDLK
jgi:hypothetical protein